MQRPLSSTYCPFCTEKCRLSVVQTDGTDPFSLNNLFPAGTITVTVHDGESPCPTSTYNSGTWYSIPVRTLSTHPEDTLFRELFFLTEHLFLRATCRLGASGRIILIRVYLIPNDLPNVRGRLHCRPETVVKEARRHLYNIVPLIEQNKDLWDADEAGLNSPQKHFLPSHIDNRTMAEIYSDLPSPILDSLPTNENTKLSHHIASGGVIWGLRSILYRYQRRSVSVMLHKESSTSPVPDPLYIAIPCMSGTHCYIQPSTMSILRERPTFSPARAGLLCEELGTGKTVMVIALVLATANQLADPEESMVDNRPVMTPLAYRKFPSQEYALARDRAGLGRKAVRQVPSLVELLVHHFSSFNSTTGRPAFTDELEASHLWPLIRANQPFYHHYNTDLALEVLKRSQRRNAPSLSPRTMYLSFATLVVVPLTLLGQWKTEIDKHCHDCVRYLLVRPSMELPHARKLASDYELILMSDSRFRKESKKNNTEKLYGLKPCTCPCLAGSRIPDCRCPGDSTVTPLLQIRWKRLVIDEGHIASNMTAAINTFVRELSIQHKWIVTGTPTSNILGLQLGRTTNEQECENQVDSADSVLDPDSTSPNPASPTQDDECRVRIWGNYDALNLRKLGAMIGDFLAVPQFHTDSKAFAVHVSAPLCDKRGPRPGAIGVLSQAMEMVMVRHRIEDVENDVLLPPMQHEIVYMDLGKYALKSYNAMQAGLAINAIDSERQGPDYLFDPSKAKDLQVAINNSLQGLFWSSSNILYNVEEISSYADEYIARAIKRQIDSEDLDLLRQALQHAAAAAKDKMWRVMQPYPDVPFEVTGLDPEVFQAWTRTVQCSSNRGVTVMHPDRLVNLRSLVRRNPQISTDRLVRKGNLQEEGGRWIIDSDNRSREAKHHAKQSKEMAKQVQQSIELLKKHVEKMDTSDEEDESCQQVKVNRVKPTEAVSASMLETSPLGGVKVGSSMSTKLNYILSEVQQYSANEKFLIFSNSLLTLIQIGEALSLFEIKYLRYTNQEQYLLREQCITTFETSDVHRVLLMELKLGARGLNLISASRIIFCEPVWHPDVESQAIKRAHRIGQTRPVTVKSLVIRSTAEETMIARRQYLRSSDKVPSMTTESGMREYLKHPRFLSESDASDQITSVVLSLDNNQTTLNTQYHSFEDESVASRVDVDTDNPAYESDGLTEAVPRKRVRFEE
ncbi:P-loop containing nucleoside triphosphate hydrolase protein [Chiua virens]|nr:P-loop containing nucleoside triphosphate hydrolase protein [Chiua virens]